MQRRTLTWILLFMALQQATRAFRPTILITGSTDGIGLTTAKNMAIKGYNVIVHGRDATRIRNACNAVQKFLENTSNRIDSPQVHIESVLADLSTIRGCEILVTQVKRLCRDKGLDLTVVLNNAGVYSEEKVITPSGVELTFAVNVVAPFVITSHLLPELLSEGKCSRIVIASSISQCRSIQDWDDLQYHKRRYSAHGAYSESKLFDAMLAKEFAERLHCAGYGWNKVTCNSLDPGTVNTKMLLAGWGPCGIDVKDALDETYLCSSPDLDGITGQYFRWRTASRGEYPATERAKLWRTLSALAPSAAEMWNFNWS